MKNISSYTLNNGVKVTYIDAQRFKTVNFTVEITTPLKRPENTLNALIPAILKRGCAKFPETKDLSVYLDELYGANTSYAIKKRGHNQVISINFNTVADIYAPQICPFKKLLELAKEMLFNPLLEDGGFNKKYTLREKENLKQYIESIINDKKEYAKMKLLDAMYQGEKYGILANGYVEDLENVTPKNLYLQYLNLLNSARIEIFVTGPVDKTFCDEFIKENFSFPKKSVDFEKTDFGEYKDEVKYITEKSDVTQGKLSIGMRTNVTVSSPFYFPMIVMNNLYGGSVHSKLFLNVREKLSLAYYSNSSYDSIKGLILVNSGIEFKNYEIALKEIINQLEQVKLGNFTENDINFSKLAITNSYKEAKDSALAMESFYAKQTLTGNTYSIEQMCEKIMAVTKDDIINAAKTVMLDTVFFLKGCE